MSESVKLEVQTLAENISAFNDDFPVSEPTPSSACLPGIGDMYLRKLKRLGHKDVFPRPYDWENLIAQLRDNEELLWIVRKVGSDANEFRGRGEIAEARYYDFDVFLGLRFVDEDNLTKSEWENRGERFETLTRHFAKNAFPESLLERVMDDNAVAEFATSVSSMQSAYIVSGMPSIKDSELKNVLEHRDERKRPFAGLNDIVEMHGTASDSFVLIFVVSRVPVAKIERNFNALFRIQNTIKPQIEKVMQISDGSSQSVTISVSNSSNESHTDLTPGGRSVVVKQEGLHKRIGRGFMNMLRWIGYSDTELNNQKLKIQKDAQVVRGTTSTSSKGEQNGVTHQETVTVKEMNSAFAFADRQIQYLLDQLTQTLGTGGYFANAVVYSDRAFTANSVANATRAALSGGQSSLKPLTVSSFTDVEDIGWLTRTKSLALTLEEEGRCPTIMNCEKACLFAPLPTTHLMGLQLKRNVFYGKPTKSNDNGVCVGHMAYAEPHILDKTQGNEDENYLTVNLSETDINSHIFLVGTTGCGKTTRAAQIIREADCFRRIIIETAKKTYWNELGVKSDDVIIYTLGDSTHRPLRINPFYFEPGTSLKKHIAVLADALADLLPMEALVGPKLREAIERSYEVCGWDVETGFRSISVGEQVPEYPNMVIFNLMVHEIAEEMSDYSADVQGNYKGALLNRAAIFLNDTFQDIFSHDGNQPLDEIFPKDKTIIIEMEEMPQSEVNLPAFIISLVLQRMRAYRTLCKEKQEAERNNGFLVVIEEAHNVLGRKFQSKSSDLDVGKGGNLVNQVTRILAEGRGLGLALMIIDQSASNIAQSVITNSNTKLVFRQEDGVEIETIGKAIGLSREEWGDLQLLEKGEFLVRNSKFIRPIKMAPLDWHEVEDADAFKSSANRSCFVPDADFVPRYQEARRLLRAHYRQFVLRNENHDGKDDISALLPCEVANDLHEKLLDLANGDRELCLYYITSFLLKVREYKTVFNKVGINR